MTQEVRVILQLTLEVDTDVTTKDIEIEIENLLQENLKASLQMIDFIEIIKESEIYGNE